MRVRSLTLPALAGLSILVLSLATFPRMALAQTEPPTNISQLDFQGADVRQALRDLFRISGSSYTIDPAVQGAVTLQLRNVSLDTALANLTRQVDATYRVENGVYAIVPAGQGAGPRPGAGFGGFGGAGQGAVQVAAEPPVMVVDGPDLFVLRRGTVYKIDKRDMKLLGQISVGPVGPGGFGGRPGGGFGGGGLGGGRGGAGGGLGGGQR